MKSEGLAAVLSFFIPGLGQIYNGQVGIGIFFMVIYACSIALIFIGLGLVTTPILWVYGMSDAYRYAKKLNAIEIAHYAKK